MTEVKKKMTSKVMGIFGLALGIIGLVFAFSACSLDSSSDDKNNADSTNEMYSPEYENAMNDLSDELDDLNEELEDEINDQE